MLGSNVDVHPLATIGDDVVLTVRSVVTKSVLEPGTYSGTIPAEEGALWRRNASRFRNLDTMAQRLRRIERMLGPDPKNTKDDDNDD